MTKRKLIIECGVAETRAALIEDDEVIRFWFGPARGDEAEDQRPLPGRQFVGKVLSVDKRLNAAFVDIGVGAPGFLPLKKDTGALSDGAMIAVTVKRSPRGGKGATLSLSKADNVGGAIGPSGDVVDAAIQAASAFDDDIDDIIMDSGAAKSVLGAKLDGHRTQVIHQDGDLFASYGAQAVLDDVFLPVVMLSSGGRLTINETEALIAIDVDTGGAAASSSSRLSEKINLEAAKAAAHEITRRMLGGKVVIDFLPTHGAARDELNDTLKKCLPGAQKAGWTKSGLFSFVLPRPDRSLLERYTEPSPASPIEGRMFTVDFMVKQLVHQMTARLRASPQAKLQVSMGSAIKMHLDERTIWAERLRTRFGVRFEFIEDDSLEERRFDLSE